MATTLRLALAQISPVLGDVEANLELHLAQAAAAAEQGVELLVFPELSLTGYLLREQASEVGLPAGDDGPLWRALRQASRQLDLVVGFVERDRRQQFRIASAYLSQGALRHVHRKVYLPTYGIFEEGRYFGHGNAVRAFDSRFGRLGLLICEDFWHVSAPYLLWLDGADILVLTSASPARPLAGGQPSDSARWVERVNQAYACLFTNFVIHCNRVGREEGVAFWGGSAVYDPSGRLLAQGPYFKEALVVADLDLAELRPARVRLPLLRDERLALTRRELERIIEQGE
ncbi:MAG: nitrilase-related carbon-nitrogen hydrolase [Candidatus Promineifilaceae bacterium]